MRLAIIQHPSKLSTRRTLFYWRQISTYIHPLITTVAQPLLILLVQKLRTVRLFQIYSKLFVPHGVYTHFRLSLFGGFTGICNELFLLSGILDTSFWKISYIAILQIETKHLRESSWSHYKHIYFNVIFHTEPPGILRIISRTTLNELARLQHLLTMISSR